MAGRFSSLLTGSRRRGLGFWARAGVAGAGVAAIAGGALLAGTAGRPTAVHSSSQSAPKTSHAMKLAAAPPNNMYWMVAADGGIFTEPLGVTPYLGGEGYHRLNQPVVGMAASPDGKGYWLVARDGGVFTEGNIGFYLSAAGHTTSPIVGMAATPDGHGYWLVGSDGHVYNFGDAPDYGSEWPKHLNQPVVGIAATPDGGGYWLVASDGGIFTHGDAPYLGGEGWHHLNQPVVGMTVSPDGKGYWLAAADGGVFTEGPIPFYGSEGYHHLNQPVVGIAASPLGHGYWMVASDGGVFTEGPDAGFGGSEGYHRLNQPVVGMAAVPVLFANTISLTPTANTIVADGVSTSTITAVVRDSSGNAIPGRTVAFSVTTPGCGSLSSTRGVTDLSGAVATTYTASTQTGNCSVRAADVNAPAAANTVVIAQSVGAPVTVTASSASDGSHTADAGNAGLPLSFTVRDAQGHAVSGAALDLTTTLADASGDTSASPSKAGAAPFSGHVLQVSTNSVGTAPLTVYDTVAGDAGTVTATLHGTGVHGSTGSISITSAALHSFGLPAVSGQTAGTLYKVPVTASDAYGNPVNPATSGLTVSGSALDTAPDGTHTGTATWEGAFASGTATLDVTSYKAEQAVLTITDNADNTINTSTSAYTVGTATPAITTPTAAQSTDADTASTTGLTQTFTVLDQYQNAVVGALVDFTSTGFSNGSAVSAVRLNPTSGKTASDGTVSTVLSDSKIDTGTVTGALDSTPATNATTGTITITAGAFKNIATPAVSTVTAGTKYTVPIAASDAEGNPVNPDTAGLTVSGSALDTAPDGTHAGTATWEGPFANGTATLDVTSYKAEQAVLTITDNADNTITASSAPYTVNPATASSITTPTTAQSANADTASGTGLTQTFTVLDVYKNGVSGVVVDFTTTGFSNGSGAGTLGLAPASDSTASDGTVSTVLTDSKVDTGTVTGALHSTPATKATTGTITITPGAFTKLALTAPATTPQAGAPYTLSLSASDAEGNGVNPVSSSISLSGTAKDVAPDGTHTGTASLGSFTNGVATVNATSYEALSGNGANLTATYTGTPSIVSNTASYNVNPASYAQLTATSPSMLVSDVGQTLFFQDPTGSSSGVVHFQAQDQYLNNTTPANSDVITVKLAPDSTAGVSPDGGVLTGGTPSPTTADTTAPVTTTVTLSTTDGTASITYQPPSTSVPTSGNGVITFTDSDPRQMTAIASSPSAIETTVTTVHSVNVQVANATFTADQGSAGEGVTSNALDGVGGKLVGASIKFTTSGLGGPPSFSPTVAQTASGPGPASTTMHATTVGTGHVIATLYGAPTTMSNLQAQSPLVTVTQGALNNLTLTNLSVTNPTAGHQFTGTVTATDVGGNPVTPSGSPSYTGSTAIATAPDGHTAGTVSIGAYNSSGQATLTATAYDAQTGAVLKVAYGAVSTSVTFNVLPDAPAVITTSISPSSCCNADTGNTGIQTTVVVKDAYLNVVPSQVMNLTTTLSHATIDTSASPTRAHSSAFGATPVPVTTDSTGTATAMVYDVVSGDTGAVDAAVPSSAVHKASSAITITPGALHALAITTPATSPTAGAPYTMTVTATDTYANGIALANASFPCTASSTPIACTGSAFDTAPDTLTGGTASVGAFNSLGQATLTVTSYKAETGVTLTVADGLINQTTSSYAVKSAAASQFVVSSPSSSYKSSTHTLSPASPGETDVFDVAMVDPWQNAAPDHLTDTIAFTLTGGATPDGGFITGNGISSPADAANTPVNASVTLANGTGQLTYQAGNAAAVSQQGTGTLGYVDSTAGTIASLPASITVTPLVATQVAITCDCANGTYSGGTYTPVAGKTDTFTVAFKDQYGNPMPSTTHAYTVTVTLTAGAVPDGGSLSGSAPDVTPVTANVSNDGTGKGTFTYAAPAVLPPGGTGTLTFSAPSGSTISTFSPASINVA